MTFRALALIVGQMAGNTLESGSGIKCMERGKSAGSMEGNMRGSI